MLWCEGFCGFGSPCPHHLCVEPAAEVLLVLIQSAVIKRSLLISLEHPGQPRCLSGWKSGGWGLVSKNQVCPWEAVSIGGFRLGLLGGFGKGVLSVWISHLWITRVEICCVCLTALSWASYCCEGLTALAHESWGDSLNRCVHLSQQWEGIWLLFGGGSAREKSHSVSALPLPILQWLIVWSMWKPLVHAAGCWVCSAHSGSPSFANIIWLLQLESVVTLSAFVYGQVWVASLRFLLVSQHQASSSWFNWKDRGPVRST